jgi:hypothetical protein
MEVQESRKILIQAEEFLKKHSNKFEEDKQGRPYKKDYITLVDALRSRINKEESNGHTDGNEDMEVRVFHNED